MAILFDKGGATPNLRPSARQKRGLAWAFGTIYEIAHYLYYFVNPLAFIAACAVPGLTIDYSFCVMNETKPADKARRDHADVVAGVFFIATIIFCTILGFGLFIR